MINYPTSLDSFQNPTGTDLLENSNAALDHDVQHSNANDAIEALQAKVGVNSSAVTTSHDYKLSEVTSTDKAVSKTATQTLTNKSLTSPKVNVGSDATGDMYYRDVDGTLTRIPVGTNTQILISNGTLPSFQDNPAGSDASTTVKGVVEIATTAEITAGTATGGTGAILVIPASAVGSAGASKLVQFDGTGKYPAVDGSAITNIGIFKAGTATKNTADASTTQNIAHGLGKTPKFVRIQASSVGGNLLYTTAFTRYDGTTQTSQGTSGDGTSVNITSTFSLNSLSTSTNNNLTQVGVVTVDSTNIIITWTKNNSPTGTYTLLWEAQA